MGQIAAIVYTNDNQHWSRRLFHEVNHCFLCVADSGQWIVCDYTSRGLELFITKELPKGLYYQLIEIDSFSVVPFIPTCVGYLKRIAGIYNPFILTPWQLLNYMRRKDESRKQTKERRENRAGSSD